MLSATALTHEAEDRLRRRFTEEEDTAWVGRLAARAGWETANRRYLAAMRERGLREMSALMREAGSREASSPEDALRLVGMALWLYMPYADVTRTDRVSEQPGLLVRMRDCPTFRRIEKSGWHGVTACGSWHRRAGWYGALGADVADALVGERKWGDVACTAELTVRSVAKPSRTSASARG